MFKKTAAIATMLAAGMCAAALAGCGAKAITYDVPTPVGDESTWLSYEQVTTTYATIADAKADGALDVVALAESAEKAPYNESRIQVDIAIEDGKWVDGSPLNKWVIRNLMKDDDQTLELYYTPLHYFKTDVSLDTDKSAKEIANDFIAAAGLTGLIGTNDEDTYDLATTDLDEELEIGNVTGYDVDHYMAYGKCQVNGVDGYWFVKVIGSWLRCYVTPLGTGFVVAGNVQEYDTPIATYDDLKGNLLRLDENWEFVG